MSNAETLHPLRDRVALVTGATRGLGRAVCRRLGALGAVVVAAGRRGADAEALVAELVRDGVQAYALPLDVTRESDRRDAVAFIERTSGRLDVLINNAAVWLESDNAGSATSRSPSETPLGVLRETFETNFFGPFALTQALLPLLRRSPAGRIVNVSSIRGSLTLQADPSSPVYPNKTLAYDTSKTALNAFSLLFAEELRHTRIKVNAVHPGWVRTDMGGPSADLGIEEGADAIVVHALLDDDGPTGGFFFREQRLPW
ncbi:SDR family oxidoreductase [Chondromyces crocatus]|uniref:Short-chain dehydrogenase n=1 Tax=Chondromyces crocatus TaxID=52 RepID=A0A0K1EN22_CHOCO|nr:SDR family oxidoreductase [Chondromyces crocatus]AKT42231.1 short-chain dehydrogenase [Chondromyces crocatus]